MWAWSDCFVRTVTEAPFAAICTGSGVPGLAWLDRAEQLLEPLEESVADVAADADDDALGPVPAVDERRERFSRRGAHGSPSCR